jgi:hypothetical protein
VPNTTIQSLPYPALSDAPNGPSAIQGLAQAVETKLVMRFASASARDSTVTSPTQGMLAWLDDTDIFTYYTGSAWVTLASKPFTPVYAQRTSSLTVNSGTEGTVATAAAVTVDGATRIRVTCSWSAINAASEGNRLEMRIKEGGTIKAIWYVTHSVSTASFNNSGGTYSFEYTPTSGSKTMAFAAYCTHGTSVVVEGSATEISSIRVEPAT